MMKRLVCIILCILMAAGCLPALGESASAGDNSRVERFLAAQAGEAKDVWVRAILEAGARNIAWAGNTATFFLRSFDPDLKELGAYAKASDRAAWRDRALANVGAWSLQVSVTFEADGSVGKKARNAFLNTVKNAARSAKGSFGKKDFTDALTDLLFRVPKTGKTASAADLMSADPDFSAFIKARPELFPCENASEWAQLMYVQRAWRYSSAKSGPHSITLNWDTLDPTALLNRALDHVSKGLAGVPASQRPSEENLSYVWRSGLAEAAIAAKKGRLTTQKIVFDIDDLTEGRLPADYQKFYTRYTPSVYYEKVVEGYRQLPAQAGMEMPKTGIISSVQKKGRGVLVKVPKDGRYTYVILRDADSGVIQAEAFIEPGKNLTMKVAEGVYIVQYATGSTWYGTMNAFGPLGSYSESEEFIVAKNKVVLVSEQDQPGITLHPVTMAKLAAVEDKSVRIQGVLEPTVSVTGHFASVNPTEEGKNPYTGLPATGNSVTPIVMVLDNAEDAYPHWGVRNADILFQVPNAGAGATKLLALFTDKFPIQAGPVRSGRSSMLPAALMFNAAFVFAGPPAISSGEVDLIAKLGEFRMSQTHRAYNLLSNNGFSERIKGIKGGGGGHNLSCHVADIHENLVNKQVTFEVRPFLFTDEERTSGATANIIRVLHRGEDPQAPSNSASRAVFKYDEKLKAYTRTNSSGLYRDRDNGEILTFANVIIIRTRLSYEYNYIYMTKHMAGSGTAEIFQNGKYVRGAWIRNTADGRLILVDTDGEELKLQRGKSFIVLTNDVTDVIYSE